MTENGGISVFDKEHAHEVIIIQLMRIYDLLLAQLAVENPEKAQQLVALHEVGQTFMPVPSFAVDDD